MSLEAMLCPECLTVPVSSSWLPEGKQLSSTVPIYHDALAHHRSETKGPAQHGLKHIKP
jgi:hypothetical protein